ncbi:unnamed protein product [Merluccius merluccius]
MASWNNLQQAQKHPSSPARGPKAADVQADDREDPDQPLEEREDTEEEIEVKEEVTHNYDQPDSAAGEQPAPQPALQHAPQPASVPASAPRHCGEGWLLSPWTLEFWIQLNLTCSPSGKLALWVPKYQPPIQLQ